METRNILNQRNAKIGAALFVAALFVNRGFEVATESAGDPVCYPDTINTSSVSLDVADLLTEKGYDTTKLIKLNDASGFIDKSLTADHKKYTSSMKGDTYTVCVQGSTVIPGNPSSYTVNDN